MSSRVPASSASSLVAEDQCDGGAVTMSIASSSSRIPPAVRKAGRLMPSQSSSGRPKAMNTSRRPVATAVPLMAMARRRTGGAEAARTA